MTENEAQLIALWWRYEQEGNESLHGGPRLYNIEDRVILLVYPIEPYSEDDRYAEKTEWLTIPQTIQRARDFVWEGRFWEQIKDWGDIKEGQEIVEDLSDIDKFYAVAKTVKEDSLVQDMDDTVECLLDPQKLEDFVSEAA